MQGAEATPLSLQIEVAEALDILGRQRDVIQLGDCRTGVTAEGDPSPLPAARPHKTRATRLGEGDGAYPRRRTGDGKHRAPAPVAPRSRAPDRPLPAPRPTTASYPAAKAAAPASCWTRARQARGRVGEPRRHRSSLSADPGPFRTCLESNGRGQHGEEPRTRSVWITPNWLGGSWPKSPPLPPGSRCAATTASPTIGEKAREIAACDGQSTWGTAVQPTSRARKASNAWEERGSPQRDPLAEVPSGARLLAQPRGRAGACRCLGQLAVPTGCSVSSCRLADKPPLWLLMMFRRASRSAPHPGDG